MLPLTFATAHQKLDEGIFSVYVDVAVLILFTMAMDSGAKTPQANRQLDMWRGMKDLDTSDEFDRRGGTELAPMATTTQLKVALEYSEARTSLLFKLRTDSFMGRGASVRAMASARTIAAYDQQGFFL